MLIGPIVTEVVVFPEFVVGEGAVAVNLLTKFVPVAAVVKILAVRRISCAVFRAGVKVVKIFPIPEAGKHVAGEHVHYHKVNKSN